MNYRERVRAWIRTNDEKESRMYVRIGEMYHGAGGTYLWIFVWYMILLGMLFGATPIIFYTADQWVSWFPAAMLLLTFHFAVVGGIIVTLYPEARGLRES